MRRAAGGLVPPGTDVAAVRISAPGWENAVLDGLQVLQSCWLVCPRNVPCQSTVHSSGRRKTKQDGTEAASRHSHLA